jgi:hypothetical protein
MKDLICYTNTGSTTNKKIQALEMEDKNKIQTKWWGTINKICQKQV